MAEQDTVVITGAENRLGRALALGFVADGRHVVGLGEAGSAFETAAGAQAAGSFDFRVVDLTDATAVDAVIAAIGPIRTLVCNASVYPRAFFLDQSAADWDRALGVNVSGVANCCRSALPAMLDANAGRVVIVGSLADINPLPASSVYSVSRAGLHALTRCVASEIDRDRFPNVLVNEFAPGAVPGANGVPEDDVESAYRHVKRLVDFASGGPTGRMFLRDREIRLNEGPKAMVVRRLRGLLGRE